MFIQKNVQVDVISNTKQQLSLKLNVQETVQFIFTIVVYTKYVVIFCSGEIKIMVGYLFFKYVHRSTLAS